MLLFLLSTALLLGSNKGALEDDVKELMKRLQDMESNMSDMKEKLNGKADKLEGEDPEIEERLNKLKDLAKNENDSIEDRVAKLEDLAKIGTLRSCFEYSQYGLKNSGSYMIDPDGGLIGQEPFQVLNWYKKTS